MKFGNYTLPAGLVLVSKGLESRIAETEIPRRVGSVTQNAQLKSRSFYIRGEVWAATPTELRQKYDELVAALYSGPQRFFEEDDADRYCNAECMSFGYDGEPLWRRTKFACTIHLLAAMPYFYSATETSINQAITAPQTITVSAGDNAETGPTITITPSTAITSLKITHINQGSFLQYDGGLVPGDLLVLDHVNMTVVKNNLDDFKNISGTFFALKPGSNDLKFEGGNLTATIKFRDAWL